jgi:spheroidene monooxygenase
MPSIPSNKRRHIIQSVTLSLYRFDTPRHKAWAFVMMGLARFSLRRMPHLNFWKLLGSGTGEGFTPIPNLGVYAILCVWDNAEHGRRTIASHRLFSRYRAHAAQNATLFLETISSRGQWSRQNPFSSRAQSDRGPIAILTRATVRLSKIHKFWQQSPAISARIGKNTDVMFKIGLGEVPLRQQLTFSIWPNLKEMSEFAHAPGPHKIAIDQVRNGNWFKEDLYARFNITSIDGHWPDFDKKIFQDQTHD